MDTQALALLADADRRHVLRELFEIDGHTTAEELSQEVAARRKGTTATNADSGDVARARISLVHNHLPRLADHGVIEYDRRSGAVRLDDTAELTSDVADAIRMWARLPEQ